MDLLRGKIRMSRHVVELKKDPEKRERERDQDFRLRGLQNCSSGIWFCDELMEINEGIIDECLGIDCINDARMT